MTQRGVMMYFSGIKMDICKAILKYCFFFFSCSVPLFILILNDSQSRADSQRFIATCLRSLLAVGASGALPLPAIIVSIGKTQIVFGK